MIERRAGSGSSPGAGAGGALASAARQAGGGRRRRGRVATRIALAALLLGLLAPPSRGWADEGHEHPKLPPGPIADRHELMEHVGKAAEAIGNAVKAGQASDAAGPAARIADAFPRFLGLFPEGSQHPLSRAKPEIWEQRDVFDRLAHEAEAKARALAETARSGDAAAVKRDSAALFKACKACHDEFRVPKKKDEDD